MIYLFAPLTLLWFLFRIWLIQNGIPFDDRTDYVFAVALLAGLVMGRKGKEPERKMPSPALLANLVLLSCWPILHHIGLWALANEFQRVNHSWTQMMVDDPKNSYGRISPKFDALYDYIDGLALLGLFWMFLLLALFIVNWRRLTVLWRVLIPALVCFWITVFLSDPGGVFAWWLD